MRSINSSRKGSFGVSWLPVLLSVVLFLTAGCGRKSGIIPGEETGSQGFTVSGKVLCAGQGIGSVVVTDGTNLTLTGEDGSYSLEFSSSATHIYLSTPPGYVVPVVNSVPQFFVGIQGIKDRKNVNFNLVASPVSDSRHFFVAIGDPQVFNDYSIGRYREVLDFLKGDIASGAINPVHMMVAGDLVFDTPELHGQLKSVSSTVGQPFYYAIGNHDHTRNSTISTSEAWDGMASKVYTGHYGPAWYSFNRGMVHYLVLDDILYRGGPDTEYSVNLTSEQLDWVKKDLACVEKDKVIIVMVHAPTKTKNTSVYGNCDQLHSLLTGYREVHIIAGHKHTNSVVADNSGITEHIVGAACGAWWAGPVCPDGTLLGYKIFEVNGTKVTWKYRAYKYPDRQFSVFKPGPRAAALRPAQELLVNVWDWDRDWSVMWSENNGLTFKDMARITAGAYDPDAYTRYGTDGLLDAELTDHLFTCIPSAGTRRVVIRAINRFKEEYAEIVEW